MKKSIYTIVLLLATVFGSLHATDIKFDGKQKLYFNSAPSWISYWNADGAVFSAYFYGPDGDKFAGQAKKIDGNIYAVIVPKGTWNHVIFTRHAPGTTKFNFNTADGFWTESRPLDLKQYQWDNYISNFNVKDDGSEPYCVWNQLYSEQPKNGKTPASIASDWGLTIENIAVCDNSTGDPFTLTPSTIDLGNGKYKYNYDMRAHAWFKTTDNGATWTNVDGKAGVRASADEGEINCNTELVGAAGSNTYYYLYAKEAEDQRLIRVSVDKDCDITCEITSFEVVPTAVNVGDNTYTMDGVVAFTKAEGNLIVECDGLSTSISSPVSPQRFSLEGLTADGNPEDFHAYFSSMGSCEMHRAATAPVPTSDATTHPVTNTTPKESTTLTPSSDGSDPWEWTLLGDPTILKNSGSNTFDAPFTMVDHDETLTYVYTEYNPTPTLAGNLIDNGSFEDVSVPFKWYTGYKNSNVLNGNKIWDGSKPDQKDIYDLAKFKGTYGYFGVTNNANTYWKLMSHVAPKDGGFMAVIDGDEIADKQAWYAATADNANLQLVRGTSYLFSFWVANINNFGELINNGRRNCAILQFHIKCHSMEDGKWYEADLGEPIDLNDPKYMDFNWHQNSSTFSTRAYFNKDFDADDVTISVVDKNNKGLTIGNDFALDDIQFRAISIVSKSIKAREFFTVNIYEKPVTVDPPVISILQTPACGKTDFTMKVTVNYSTLNNKFTPITLQLTDNIYGDLFATPVVLDPAVNPNSITFTLSSSAYPMLVADGKVHTLTAKITRLDGAGVDKGGQNSSTYTSPGIPAIETPVLTELNKNCDKTTYDLQVATNYRAFTGTKLYYEWDGKEWKNAVNPSLNYKELDWQTATGKLQNLPADGKTHTLRVYSKNVLDCEYTIDPVTSPFSPAINKIDLGTPDYTCGVAQYQLELTIDYTNGLGRKIFVKEGTTELAQFVTENDADKHQKKVTVKLNFDVAHNLNIFFEGLETDCPHNQAVAAVAKPSLGTISYDYKTACDQTTFDLDVEIKNFINQDGKLTISIDGKTVTSTDFTPNSASKQTQKLTVNGLNADGNNTSHVLSVAFDGSHGCSDTKTLTGVPKTPKIGEVTHKITQGGCNTKTYDLEISVPFENPNGNLVVTDGGSLTQTILEANLSSSPAKFTFPGITSADGSKTFQVYFTSASDCKHPVTFTEPTRPVIGVINTTPDPASCDQTTFTLKGNVSFEFGAGNLVITDVESGKFQSISAGSWASPQNFTISGIPADGKTHTVNVKFDGDDASCPGVDKTYTAPYSPAISSTTAVPQDYACGDATYQVVVTVNYANTQDHDLVITDEAGHEKTLKATDAEYGASSASWTFDMPWVNPAVSHTFKAYFVGAESCKDEASHLGTYTTPIELKIDSVIVTPNKTDLLCDESSYTADVAIYLPFVATGKSIVLSYEGKSKTVPVNGNPTTTTLTMTTTDQKGVTISADFSDATNTCAILSHAFDTPKKWTCDKDSAHICVGGSYNWHSNDYAPATEGLHKFRDNYDSLFLFVHAEPTVTMLPAEIICESENEIRLPFVIKSGTPNNFDISVNGHNFTQAMNNDTIVLSRPSDIAAGTYTATITVRDSLVSCFTTTQVRFSVAKADIMYRKWEDVIFIDNSSSLFTAYQWFETTRGELGGETKQYLHNPTGLPGIYFCRMITTAGDTLYTCASTFEDITRSRDVTGTATQQISVSPTYVRANGGITVSQTAEQQLTIMLYDATGKMTHRFTQSDAIGTIEAPEQVGVYVIRVTDGEVTQTAKIVVHE